MKFYETSVAWIDWYNIYCPGSKNFTVIFFKNVHMFVRSVIYIRLLWCNFFFFFFFLSLLRFLDHIPLNSLTHARTHPMGLLLTSNQLVADTSTYTTITRHRRQTSMHLTGFESAMPTSRWPKTHALDRRATEIGLQYRLTNTYYIILTNSSSFLYSDF